MPSFAYDAFTRNGEPAAGTIDATSEADARANLRSDGLLVLELRPARAAGLGRRQLHFGTPKVKLKDVAWAARNLATTQSAGLPVVRALRMLGRQRRGTPIGDALLRVHEAVVNGAALADAFRMEERSLTPLTTALVEAGEANGKLDSSLVKLAELCEARVRLRRKIVSAMAYPVVMIVLVMCIFMAMLVFVVPTFSGLYDQLGGRLPWLTSLLLTMSDFVRSKILVVLAVVVGAVVAFRKLRTQPRVRDAKDRIILGLPVVGELFRSMAMARLSTTMASSLGAGVPLLDSLRLAGNVANNVVFDRALEQAREEVREGRSLAAALEGKPHVPELFVQLVAVGEETGRVDELLVKYAKGIEDEVEAKVEGLTSMLEPMMIVVLGGIIGVMVVGLYLPLIGIFKLLQ
jgi:type IV pilus assembly protein PilC